ncbi:MAG: Periplasmic copper-binding protein (NosD) [Candidatus Syntrophoarchaeum sp. GoM_oil]|nr:MAG: Periplasmic copper-binding protein (NosD) [Candidatus Syntrophoarchaeum sp. GoM_oil]
MVEKRGEDLSYTNLTLSSAIYYVNPGESIQAAVNAASPGDTIIVRDGAYAENVYVNKPHLTIRSENGADVTVVEDYYWYNNVFYVTADYVNISSFTATGATGTAGIYLENADHCNISKNTCSNKYFGIGLSSSNNNTLTGNTCLNNNCGILLSYSSNNNTLTSNAFINDGLHVWTSYKNTVENNTVNGKPLVYLEDISSFTVQNAGQVILVNCINITVENLNLSNTCVGIELLETNNCKIANNTCSDNYYYGIDLWYSNNNLIYLNNFIDNTANTYPYSSDNFWNSKSTITYSYHGSTFTNYLGNYYSEYTGTDADNDGIGDDPYSIDSYNDYYPLMEKFENYVGGGDTTHTIITHPKDLAIGVPLKIKVSSNKASEITVEIGAAAETKTGKDPEFTINTAGFDAGASTLVVKSDGIECYRSDIRFYYPRTVQELIYALDSLDDAANTELLQISAVPARCTSLLLKDVLLDYAGKIVGDVLGDVIKDFRSHLDEDLGEWMQDFGSELIKEGGTQNDVDRMTDFTEEIVETIEDQAEAKLNEEVDKTIDQVIDEILMRINEAIRDAVFNLYCKAEMDEMSDRTEQLKNDIVVPTEEECEVAKQLIRIGKDAISNTDDEMIYSLDLIITISEPSINHFEERFNLARDLNGVYAIIKLFDLRDVVFGAGESLLTVPVHLGWIGATPDDDINTRSITLLAIVAAIKKILLSISLVVEASSYIILGGTFSSTPILAEEVNEEHADTINAVRDILDGQKMYAQMPMMELNGRELTVSPTNLVVLSPDGKILEFKHIEDQSRIVFPAGEYRVVSLSAEPEVIEIASTKGIQDELTMNVWSEKAAYPLGETVNISVIIENDSDQEIDNAMLLLMVTPEENATFTDLISLPATSFTDLNFNITAEYVRVFIQSMPT